MNDDTVILNIRTYNKFKNSEIKANLVIDRLFEQAQLNSTKDGLTFKDTKALSDLLQLAYPERYANKVMLLQDSE